MSDQNHHDPDLSQDEQDLELSSLYHRVSDEQPPAALDQAILRLAADAVSDTGDNNARAREPAHDPHKPYGPFTMHWPRVGAVAAMVLLSVILVNTIERQGDKELSEEFSVEEFNGAPLASQADKARKRKAEESRQVIKKKVEKKTAPLEEGEAARLADALSKAEPAGELSADESRSVAAGAGQAADAEVEADTDTLKGGRRDDRLVDEDGYLRLQVFERKPATKEDTGKKVITGSTETTVTMSSAESVAKTGKAISNPAMPASASVFVDRVERPTPAEADATADVMRNKSLLDAGTEHRADDKAQATMAEAAPGIGRQLAAPTAPVPAPAIAPEKREKTRGMLSGSSPEQAPAEEAPATYFSPETEQVVAKEKSKYKAPSKPKPELQAALPKQNLLATTKDANSQNCAGLSAAQCLRSSVCTLEKPDSANGNERTVCRAAVNHCEQGFRQGVDALAQCVKRPGCLYQSAVEGAPAKCYLPK